MANFERIKDVVLEYANEYAQEFANQAPYRTGRLKSSYRGVAQLSENKFTIQIYGEYYGPFQSYGVGPAVAPFVVPEGINPRPSNNTTYQFKNPNRYIKANPFMQRAEGIVTPKFTKALEEAGVEDIENFFNSLSKIKVS